MEGECVGTPGCKWNSHHLLTLLKSSWLPTAGRKDKIIIQHLSSCHLGTTLSSPFSHISWEGCAIKAFIHFLIYPKGGWREGAAAAPKPPQGSLGIKGTVAPFGDPESSEVTVMQNFLALRLRNAACWCVFCENLTTEPQFSILPIHPK